MGYDIEQRDTQFSVAPAQQDAARRAAQALLSPDDISLGDGGVFIGGQPEARWFSFMNHTMQDFADARTLAAVLDAWRWTPTVANDGTITGVSFRGSRLADCHLLFEAIGPYVSAGPHITMWGEDGAEWQYRFDGSSCVLRVLVAAEWGPKFLQVEPWQGDEPTGRLDTGAAHDADRATSRDDTAWNDDTAWRG